MRVSYPLVCALIVGLTGCTSKTDSGSASNDVISVVSTDDACTLSVTEAAAGNLTFEIRNEGSQVTEFYLYKENGTAIAGEAENIGPGLTRKLVVTAAAGTYVPTCKPGMTGDGIRQSLTITGTAVAAGSGHQAALDAATKTYAAYVQSETALLLDKTTAFAADYVAGKDDAARAAYAPTRMHWERIEPVAESFGDLDPRLDLREADLEAGQVWTGWHRIEHDLWLPADATAMTPEERKTIADQLVADTKDLASRVETLTYSAAQIGNGAKELLDEVATGKVTGEEEIWSHTDLWDFQANVEGAHEAFESLEPVVSTKDPALVKTIDDGFSAVQALLDTHKSGDGWVLYDALSPEEVKALADAVNALAEPLSHLSAAALG